MSEEYKARGESAKPQRVAVVESDYGRMESAVAAVVERLDLGSWLGGLRGKKVFIKPNMIGLFEPERHASTHPTLVREMVRLFRAAGAEVMVGDNCGVGGYGLNQRVARKTGILEAAEGAYVNVATDTVQAKLQSRYLDSIVVSRAMLSADALVSLPKLKTHGLTVITGAVKNMFGLVSGAGKSKSHAAAPTAQHFGRLLADIFSLRPPDLTVMDGVVGMEGNGPTAGRIKPVGIVLASRNAVALDAVACRVMGAPVDKVRHLKRASKLGHGPIADGLIEVAGKVPEARFKLPTPILSLTAVNAIVNSGFFGRVARSKLWLNEKKCQGCQLCVEGCPSGAMSFEKVPRVADDKCIRCLCCYELCPESAWELRGLIGRMRGRSF